MSRRLPRVKWHMLRRRKSDPPFLRDNLAAALAAGAACEVDIRFTADGHALCLHDATLDRETTGSGPVAGATRRGIERLRQRGSDGAVLDTPPLFFDEIAAAVACNGPAAPATLQLDVKTPATALTDDAIGRVASLLREQADAFIASAYDWQSVQKLVGAVPGLHAGFDPLKLYARPIALDAAGFVALANRTRALAAGASVYYLEAGLILAALERGVNLVREFRDGGATRIDAWTIDADRADLADVLAQLVTAGCDQITSNDPESLLPLVTALKGIRG
jgi:glycerophosphoryl diester phosphodiesterase